MLAISRLRPRNSESKWVGVLCEIQDGVQLPAYKSILYRGDLINFFNNMGAPMRYIVKFTEKFINFTEKNVQL